MSKKTKKREIPVVADVVKKSGIVCLNDGAFYESAESAGKLLRIAPGKIRDVLSGKRAHIRGYRFAYHD